MRPYIACMSKEGKDHYIPVFYLSQWNDSDHELCEFRRRDGKIDWQWIGPKGTGFMRGLYSVPGVPPEKARYVETEFVQKLDDKAARALRAMLTAGTGDINLSDTLSAAWASFQYSLILRVPETMKTVQKQLDDYRAKFSAISTNTASIAGGDGIRHTVQVKHRELMVQEVLPDFLLPGLVVRELCRNAVAHQIARGHLAPDAYVRSPGHHDQRLRASRGTCCHPVIADQAVRRDEKRRDVFKD